MNAIYRNPELAPEIMDVADLAALLGLKPQNVYRLVHFHGLPCRRAGKNYLFLKPVVLKWLAGENA